VPLRTATARGRSNIPFAKVVQPAPAPVKATYRVRIATNTSGYDLQAGESKRFL